MIAGHSAGAQLTQRYAALRKSRKDDDRIVYWMANPGSLLWLTEDRPLPNDSCANVDRWKYGLTDGVPAYGAYALKHLQREGIVERYLSRNIHYAWGTGYDGPGDTRCQAQVSRVPPLRPPSKIARIVFRKCALAVWLVVPGILPLHRPRWQWLLTLFSLYRPKA